MTVPRYKRPNGSIQALARDLGVTVNTAWKSANRADGRCATCPNPSPTRFYCDDCAAKRKAMVFRKHGGWRPRRRADV